MERAYKNGATNGGEVFFGEPSDFCEEANKPTTLFLAWVLVSKVCSRNCLIEILSAFSRAKRVWSLVSDLVSKLERDLSASLFCIFFL
jgi:hypothetical protein